METFQIVYGPALIAKGRIFEFRKDVHSNQSSQWDRKGQKLSNLVTHIKISEFINDVH